MIKLTDRYCVDVGTNNYSLVYDEQKCDKNGKRVYSPVSYHGTLEAAIWKARSESIRDSLNTETTMPLAEAIKIIKNVNNEFSAILKKAMEEKDSEHSEGK